MAFVQAKAAQASSSTTATTAAVTTTAGNCLVVGGGEGQNLASTPNDSKTNTWVGASTNPLTTLAGSLWCAKNALGGASHTFSLVVSPAGFPSIIMGEFSGRHLTAPLHAQNGEEVEYVSGVLQDGPDITTSIDGCDLVAFIVTAATINPATLVPGAGWTKPTGGSNVDAESSTASFMMYRENVAAGTYSADFTATDRDIANVIVFALAPAAGGGSGTTITPSVGSLTAAGAVASRATNFARAAVVGALAITGAAPVVTNSGLKTVTPSAGSLAFTGQQPSQDLNVPAPIVGALALTGNAPVVRQGTLRVPAVGALALTGVAPIVSAQQGTTRVPTVGAISLTGNAPSVTQQIYRTPAVGALSVTEAAPIVQLSILIRPAVGAVGFTGQTVGIGLVGGITPFAGTISISGSAPIVLASQSRAPSVGSIAFVGSVPIITRADTIIPNAGTLGLTGLAPNIQANGDHLVVPSVGSISIVGELVDFSRSGVDPILPPPIRIIRVGRPR